MNHRYKIPDDIYERVHELMVAIVNAGAAEDEVLQSSYYEQLRVYCEEQTEAGRGSGFLWEALADVTGELSVKIEYYNRALDFARQNSEPTHTALLAVGELCIELGHWGDAEEFLIAARDEAIACGDDNAEGEAVALLLQAPEKEA
jgi:hypothetical protein